MFNVTNRITASILFIIIAVLFLQVPEAMIVVHVASFLAVLSGLSGIAAIVVNQDTMNRIPNRTK